MVYKSHWPCCIIYNSKSKKLYCNFKRFGDIMAERAWVQELLISCINKPLLTSVSVFIQRLVSEEKDQSPGREMRWVFVVEGPFKKHQKLLRSLYHTRRVSRSSVDTANAPYRNTSLYVYCSVWTHVTSISATLFEAPRVSRFWTLKCHRPTSAKMVFINVIHPLWIAVTTTEKPSDIW